MLLNFNLPVYEVRAFDFVQKEGTITYVITKYRKYILDDTSLEGDYTTRRIKLFGLKNKETPLYPIHRKISTLPQLLNSKASKFITEEGKLVVYKKTKYYTMVVKPVVSCTRIYNGKFHNYVAGISHPFVTREPYAYLTLIEHKNSFLLFDAHTEKPEKIRYRIKI